MLPQAIAHAADRERASDAQGSEEIALARRVVIDRFHGKDAETVRAGANQALEEEDAVDVVAVRLLESQADELDGTADAYIALARRLNLAAIVRGKVKRDKGGPLRVTLTVINGADGLPVGKVVFEAKNASALRSKVAQNMWSEIESMIRRTESPRQPSPNARARSAAKEAPAAPPHEATPKASDARRSNATNAEKAPPEKPAAAESEEESDGGAPPENSESEHAEKSSEEPPRATKRAENAATARVVANADEVPMRRCPWLEAEPNVGVLARTYNYRNEQRGALRAYILSHAPSAGIDLSWYPLAGRACNFGSGIGLRLGYDQPLAIKSQLEDRSLGVTARAYYAELALRVPLGAVALKSAFGYAARTFDVSAIVPSVEYQSLLASVGAELRAGAFVADAEIGGRLVLEAGPIKSAAWFPNARALGYRAGVRVGVEATDWLDILAGGSIEYYSFNFDMPAGAASMLGSFPNGVADGAFDQYLSAMLTARFRVLGKAPKR